MKSMKSLATGIALTIAFCMGAAVTPRPVSAQAGNSITVPPQFVNSLSQCAWPTGGTVTNGVAYCFVYTGTASSSGMYWAVNGGTTWNPFVPPPSAAGVSSFNGRTGAVTLTKADVTGTSLTATTTLQ